MSLTNAQFEEIQYEYDTRRDKNLAELNGRKTELFARFPRLKEIEDEISKSAVAYTRKKILGDAPGDLSAMLSELTSERERILSSNGYPPDYLKPLYDCPDCKDTGYVDGKKCHCLIQRTIELVYAQSNLSSILNEENFESFRPELYRDEKRPNERISPRESAGIALSHTKKFVEDFDRCGGNLLFRGNTGVGKTFLSNCAAKALLDTGHSVAYFTSTKLFDIFAKYRFYKDGEAGEKHHMIFDCDLLIIDDLGTEVANKFTSSQLFILLNERMQNKSSTIISTNLTIRELAEEYSERIFSRISSGFTILELLGDDIRIKKKLMKQ